MQHLVFLPRASGGPRFFLWASDRERSAGGAVAGLATLGEPAEARLVTEALGVETVSGRAIPLLDGVAALSGFDAADLLQAPPSVITWSLAAKLALDLVARERVVPFVRPFPGGAEARWGVSLAVAEDSERFARLARALPPAAHAVPVNGGPPPAPPGRPGNPPGGVSVWASPALLAEFLDAAADALVRRAIELPAGVAASAPRRGGRWEQRWLDALTGGDGGAQFAADGFVERALLDELADWAAPARGAAADSPRLCLKLDPPPETPGADDGGNSQSGAWTLGYFLQAPDDPSLLLPAERVWAAGETRLAWMDRVFEAPHEALLRSLAQAARLFPPIERSLEAARPQWVRLGQDEAWWFLSEGAPLLAAAGFAVRVPAALTPSGQRRLRVRLRVGGAPPKTPSPPSDGPALDLDGLVGFRWEAALGDTPLSQEEFRGLAALKRPLVRWRGQWLILDPREVTEVRRLLDGARGGRITVREALAAALAETVVPPEGLPVPVNVVPEGALATAIARLRSEPPPLPPPAELAGTLRPYQARGLGWLGLLAELGLGGCLADDMGLGKTVQAIAFMLARRAMRPEDGRPALVVCPTSVLGNWERELARFAPSLPVLRHHGPSRARTPQAYHEAPSHAVVVTTYSLLRRDHVLLASVPWASVFLDEAQNVKNASARQAVAARALNATHRFALTGTPVENRLAELWSIFEFCLPGVLGPLAGFRRRYAIPVERYRDDRAAAELRRLVRPFVLRRLKSDPAVAADIPPKQEMSVVCTLTREQATLYQAAVDEAMNDIAAAAGVERRGRILALLTALKQICNHPAHYLGEAGPLTGRSGKLDRVTEMLEETVAAGDRALVFTQFREMGTRLVAHLERTLATEIPFLHGGTPPAARDAMVARFQEDPLAPPIFVLSLRAGGTGLNLTRATRVFHFDRWWNPAVEDQATDRAHRIGQQEAVQVYKLLAAGTLEEKIDRMLTDKRGLADRIISAGETWITELSDDELRELVSLSADAVVETDEDGEAAPRKRRRPAAAGRR
jgi:superfamily II DNA or RNA helicase